MRFHTPFALCCKGLLLTLGCSLLFTSCKKEPEDAKQIAISYAQDSIAGRPILFYVEKKLTGIEWDFGDTTTSTELKPAHVYKVRGGYTVTVKGRYNDRDYTGYRWLYVTDIETINTLKYSAGLSRSRSWKHSYVFDWDNNRADSVYNYADTGFAFKMVNDSTLADNIILETVSDSTLIYISKTNKPSSFWLKYNFQKDQLTFINGSTTMAGEGKHSFISK